MKKNIFLLLLFTTLFCVKGIAKRYTVKDIPMVHLQDRMRYVSNPDGILSSAAVATMDNILYELEQQTGIETVVVAVEEIASDDCFEFALQIGQQYGVGKKKTDNGLVILLVRKERCVQFVTGYGIEGDLPDAICKRIQEREMFPLLKQGKWDEGMIAGIRAVHGYLEGSMEFSGDENEYGENTGLLVGMLIFVILSFFLLTFFMERKRTRCPNCKKHTLRRSNSKLVSKQNGLITKEVIYTCTNCGHTVIRNEDEEDNTTHFGGGRRGGSMGGPFIFGSGGRRSSGGGFSRGGSFGGGRFGGGGAGGRF